MAKDYKGVEMETVCDISTINKALELVHRKDWLEIFTWINNTFAGMDTSEVVNEPSSDALSSKLYYAIMCADLSIEPSVNLATELAELPYWCLRVSKKTEDETQYWSPTECTYREFAGSDEITIFLDTTPFPEKKTIFTKLLQIIDSGRDKQ